MTKRRRKVTGTVIFSDGCNPDVEGAMAELRRHGFAVLRMPEKFRPLLYAPKDDFAQVWKPADLSSDDYGKLPADEQEIVLAIMDEANDIVACFGAAADSFGPAQPGELPFVEVFGEEIVSDDAKLVAEIEKRKGAVMNKRNRERAAWAKIALTAFTDAVGKSDPATEIADLIGDLMHLARTHRLHPLDVASHGIGMWSAEERAPDGEPQANDDAHIAISRGHI